MTDDRAKRHGGTSELFPRVYDDPKRQAAETFDVLARHGRVLTSHTNRFIDHDQRLTDLERADPVQSMNESEKRFIERVTQLETRFTDKVSQLDKDIIRLRTAVYVAAVILGTGLTGNIAADTIRKTPTVQIPPEVLEALKK